MFWNLSFHLLPDEVVIDDSSEKSQTGIKPAYSVFLTNMRAVFRFDGFGSSLTRSFFINEILDAKPTRRLFVNYISVRTREGEVLLNVAHPEYWSEKILNMRGPLRESPEQTRPLPTISSERTKRELVDMLTTLKKHSLLTDGEFEEKIRLVDSMKF